VITYNNKLNAAMMYLKDFVDCTNPKVSQGAKERLNDLRLTWQTFDREKTDIVTKEMSAYNEMYKSLKLPALIIEEK
jgi:hypothetical protein